MTSKSLFRAFHTPHTPNLAKPSAHASMLNTTHERSGKRTSNRSAASGTIPQKFEHNTTTAREHKKKCACPAWASALSLKQYELNSPRTQTNPQGLFAKRLNSPCPHSLASNIQGSMIAFVHGIGDSARSHCIAHHPHKGSSIT